MTSLESSGSPDLLLFTDGSGHMDGLGGWCAVVESADRTRHVTRLGCASGSSVDSMEFHALLEGLDACLEAWNTWPLKVERKRVGGKPIVLWRSDRESLVLSVTGSYRRSNLPHMWARFAYYEKELDIRPFHIGREEEKEHPEFQACDLHASTMREVLKAYLKNQQPVLEMLQLPGMKFTQNRP